MATATAYQVATIPVEQDGQTLCSRFEQSGGNRTLRSAGPRGGRWQHAEKTSRALCSSFRMAPFPARILVVEDADEVRELLVLLLEEDGFSVASCAEAD